MKLIDIESLMPPGGNVANFQGIEHGANVSFFVVHFSQGEGPRKHRHPYEETFVILEGEIELLIDGMSQQAGGGKIAVIPAGAWHEFKVISEKPVNMINIHPTSKMVTEWA